MSSRAAASEEQRDLTVPTSTGVPAAEKHAEPRSGWSRRQLLLFAGVPAVATACAVLGPGEKRPAAPGPTSTGSPAPTASSGASTAATAAAGLGPLVWSAEFDGRAGSGVDPKVWRIRTGAGGWGNGELQCYTGDRDNVSVDGNGNLQLTMQRRDVVDADGNSARFTSGRIETVEAYPAGRIEARMRIPSGIGLWAAFWTVGADFARVGWPASGEIDIVEHYDDTGEIEVVVHGATDPGTGTTELGDRWKQLTTVDVPGLADDFHVYAVDITETALLFSVDGVVRATVTRAQRADNERWPFDQPQRIVLNLAMSRWLGDREPPLPASLVVDYVRVYDRPR